MADAAPNFTPHDQARHRFRLPHWGWCLLATVVVVICFVGLSVWLPHHRERQVIQKIESLGGDAETETRGPEWLRKRVGDDRMKDSKIFERVITVKLYGSDITNAEIVQLVGLTNLEELHLSRTGITDAGLTQMRSMPNLRTLYIRETAVTDAGLDHLKGCANLESLFLNETFATEKGIEELRTALPNCAISN